MAIQLKHALVLGVSVALLGACSSTPEEKPAEAAAKPAEAPKPAAAPAATRAAEPVKQADAPKPAEAPKPAAPKTLTIKGTGLFDFNKSELRADAKAELDKNVVAKKADVKAVSGVAVNGHADRIGSQDYNLKLSEKRAEVVKAYLVGKGVPANNIETFGFGKTQPATGANVKKCEDSLPRAELIKCLQPHRRVEVELKGEAK